MSQTRKYFRTLSGERCESRHYLTAIGFAVHDAALNDSVASVSVADIDGDGDNDLLTGALDLAWRENIDGLGTFESRHVIASRGHGQVAVSDVDGDGDIDVVASNSIDETIVWYANSDSETRFGRPQTIGVAADVRELLLHDIDGDLDVVVKFVFDDGEFRFLAMAWYENLDGLGSFGE